MLNKRSVITLLIAFSVTWGWSQNSEWGVGVRYDLGVANANNELEQTYNGAGLGVYWCSFMTTRWAAGLSSSFDLLWPAKTETEVSSSQAYLHYIGLSGQINLRFNLFPSFKERKFGSPFIGIGTGLVHLYFTDTDASSTFVASTLLGEKKRTSSFAEVFFGINVHKTVQLHIGYVRGSKTPDDNFESPLGDLVKSGFSNQSLDFLSLGINFQLANQS